MRTDPVSPLDAIPDPTATTGSELGKSRETRRRILEAATACIAEMGYDRFSTAAVAARAGLTRPAMLYHFNSRLELLTATIHFLARRRIELFEQAMLTLPKVQSYKGQYLRAKAAEVAWDQLQTPYFWAFAELSLAARTDKDLEPIVKPALECFDRARRGVTDRIFPEEAYDMTDFSLARDVVRFLSEGVAIQDSFIHDRAERTAALRHFLKMLVATTPGATFLEAVVEDWNRENGVQASQGDAAGRVEDPNAKTNSAS